MYFSRLTPPPPALNLFQSSSQALPWTKLPLFPPPLPDRSPHRAIWASTDHLIWFSLPALRQVLSPILDSMSPSV